MSDLVEWLRACIAEDETAARRAQGGTTGTAFGAYAAEEVLDLARSEGAPGSGLQHFEGWMPARVLAVCQAHRTLIDVALENANGTDMRQLAAGEVPDSRTWEAVHIIIAAAYADRPGYREEWKP